MTGAKPLSRGRRSAPATSSINNVTAPEAEPSNVGAIEACSVVLIWRYALRVSRADLKETGHEHRLCSDD
jgi:hypothetical protein